MPLARSIARAIGAAPVATLDQTDIIYNVPHGHFFKRICPDEPVEYIRFARSPGVGVLACEFSLYSEDQARLRFGAKPIPVSVVVRKSREIHVLGQVRIHLDRVDMLGDFLELEALISTDRHAASCRREIATLREALAPALGEPVGVSYAEMITSLRESAQRFPTW